jgi:transcriptional regulator with XRE-family HTH domain/Zn-dependent peptidase ImmA (M78 family)
MNYGAVDSSELGKRIRLLRRSRHWTQAELAAKVGIRTGPMNYLENGHHLPSVPVLCKLAAIFDVPVDQLLGKESHTYLSREPEAAYGGQVRQSEDCKWVGAQDYRAQHAMLVRFDPVKTQLTDAQLDSLEEAIDAFFALEDIRGVQKQAQIPLQIRLPLHEAGFERFVGQVRGLLGVNEAVIFDYLELLENAGLRIVFLPLSENIESLSCYDRANANAFIFVNSEGLSIERQLFRLGYELGRVYLYNGGTRGSMQIGTLDAEHAARRFAALFLMPAEAVLSSVRQVGVGPEQWTWEMLMRLKHRFGVSAEAFLYRLGELELISNAVLLRLKNEIHAYYAAHQNTEPDQSRRILTPNGRLGDLLLSASILATGNRELAEIQHVLKTKNIKMP